MEGREEEEGREEGHEVEDEVEDEKGNGETRDAQGGRGGDGIGAGREQGWRARAHQPKAADLSGSARGCQSRASLVACPCQMVHR